MRKEIVDNFDIKDHPCKDLRLIWHSVAPHIRSGYGTVTRHICTRLHELGVFLVISAYYGIEPGGVVLINNVPCVPCKRKPGEFGRESYIEHFKAFRGNVGILMSDFWAFPWFPEIGYSLLYSPMDHINYGLHPIQIARKYRKVVSLLPFQQKELMRVGIMSQVIEHGVDPVFKPIPKKEAREQTKLPDDKFIIGIVSANSDKEMRKGWGEMFHALEMAFEERPDFKKACRIFTHTDPEDPRGVSLKALAHKHGIINNVGFEESHLAVVGIPDNEMCLLYNSFDVLLCGSKREGFGLPILEGFACELPAIVHDFSSMTDLVHKSEKRGWLARSKMPIDTPIAGTSAIVDPWHLKEKILEAFDSPSEIEKRGKEARKFSQTLLWDDLIINKWIPLLDQIASEQKRFLEGGDVMKVVF